MSSIFSSSDNYFDDKQQQYHFNFPTTRLTITQTSHDKFNPTPQGQKNSYEFRTTTIHDVLNKTDFTTSTGADFHFISFHFKNYLRRGTLLQKCWFSRAPPAKIQKLYRKKKVTHLTKLHKQCTHNGNYLKRRGDDKDGSLWACPRTFINSGTSENTSFQIIWKLCSSSLCREGKVIPQPVSLEVCRLCMPIHKGLISWRDQNSENEKRKQLILEREIFSLEVQRYNSKLQGVCPPPSGYGPCYCFKPSIDLLKYDSQHQGRPTSEKLRAAFSTVIPSRAACDTIKSRIELMRIHEHHPHTYLSRNTHSSARPLREF